MKKTVALILAILVCLITILPSFVFAGDINTDNFSEIYKNKGNTKLVTAGGKVLGVARVIGVSCGVICLLILAIKYIMMSSNSNDKATIKEKLIPYVIGAVLLFAGTGILSIIANFAQKMDTPATGKYNSQTDKNYTVAYIYPSEKYPVI